MRRGMVALVLCGVSVLSGCHAVGPYALRSGRALYGQALQQTSNEQLLLNLVRLRYRDAPVFFEVASITTSFDEEVTLGGNVSGRDRPVNNAYGMSAGMRLAEHPTIVYVPMQSERFAKQMLTPISADVLLLLSHSGWSMRRVFAVCVQRMNGLQNAPRASGPTPPWAPEYKEFQRAAHLMRVLQIQDALYLEAEAAAGGQSQIMLRLEAGAENAQEVAELRKLLAVGADRDSYPVTPGVHARSPNTVAVSTRSVLAAMHYLSQGVDVPKDDLDDGKVTQTRVFKTNETFDWQDVLKEVFRVRCRSGSPSDAAVAVQYRGMWFYIDDADLDSKSTFSMLTQLMALQAGDIRGTTPVLTIPVTR